ncbi:teichoic acids export ABC transporter ATP-binding subunit TagH [Aquisalibacillus elongatus]|uniref:Teichoic acid transport system ATP-binding protein n=1 Tax=Aquisalibacillus elongatus TaxID=485577 RepID=A0A3N5B9V3_9BACI|nr:teichoic acids export ABC transporter ATP-binding subunit TagH [Aquisalibacillus elongatus]RPF54183.1 teichoic acid transport system ATP-binding protein [Aquisalibacillus elongatus]
MEKPVKIKNVSKKYKLYGRKMERLKDLLIPGKSYGKDFFALKNVSFEADKGDIVGFVGVNGSGKSTLSNIIAGVIPQTTGEVEVKGQAALIAVNIGLDRKLTGRENIELKLLMLGFSKKEINELEDDIIEFSELGQFIDQPVKSYSSGMKSRLGFSISVNVDPDILIIDEALSVGDKAFAEKSLAKMQEFKEAGKTMFFVSHSLGQMKTFCEKVLWLEFGEVRMYGETNEVLNEYEAFLENYKNMSKKQRKKFMEQSRFEENG